MTKIKEEFGSQNSGVEAKTLRLRSESRSFISIIAWILLKKIAAIEEEFRSQNSGAKPETFPLAPVRI